MLRANLSVDNAVPQSLSPSADEVRNSWQQQGWSAARSRSADPAIAEGSRTAVGELPGTAFLTTGNGTGASMAGS